MLGVPCLIGLTPVLYTIIQAFTLRKNINTRFCPLVSKLFFKLKGPDQYAETFPREFLAYKEIVKQWNENPGKEEDCFEFLLSKSKEYIER